MNIDTDRLGRLLMLVEAEAHRHGWDGEPRLLHLDDLSVPEQPGYRPQLPHGRPPVVCERYTATDAVPPAALAPNAAHALFRLAANMSGAPEHPVVQAALQYMRRPGFMGLAMLYEGYGIVATQRERAALGDVRFADVPGARECRMVTAVTVDHGVYQVNRIRGHEPELQRPEMRGAMPESLRVLVAAIAGQPVPKLTTTPSRWAG